MTISITVSSLDELKQFCADYLGAGCPAPVKIETETPTVSAPEGFQPVPEKMVTPFDKDREEVDIVKVRAVLKELTRDKQRECLEHFGAKKLTEIPAERYGEVLAWVNA